MPLCALVVVVVSRSSSSSGWSLVPALSLPDLLSGLVLGPAAVLAAHCPPVALHHLTDPLTQDMFNVEVEEGGSPVAAQQERGPPFLGIWLVQARLGAVSSERVGHSTRTLQLSGSVSDAGAGTEVGRTRSPARWATARLRRIDSLVGLSGRCSRHRRAARRRPRSSVPWLHRHSTAEAISSPRPRRPIG